ncbi:cytochrome o ubiquinol oxidase subunit IV [Palleronia sp. LCG004]|uniref:cytochrome o ubiquinol oxidase subunit IV n=1 Tax=Palleronia sp. LCG004 TaxID=3079304 RepID=UPI002943E9CD|nr:cytochrome o ubiquinol oxidase subunit IV [Palleronia sp. LCG004]WOI56623.1 cytochrome o ubiquinol oxidase subunit IV [Palleronia sp. LCG004]
MKKTVKHFTRSLTEEESEERSFYSLGLVLSILLTVLSFTAVMTGLLPRAWVIPVIILLALAQILVHLRIFLHIDLSRQKREDLLMLLFTILLLAIMAFGTLWIMSNLHDRMM